MLIKLGACVLAQSRVFEKVKLNAVLYKVVEVGGVDLVELAEIVKLFNYEPREVFATIF